jgi:hypothetical protein
MSTLGPNTNAPQELLSKRCVLVVGEDRRDVVALLGSPGETSHSFRNYEFWKQADFTLVLSGIGTGCVEPLMWELLRAKVIEEIILIGTAGKMPGASIPIGQPCAISDAFLGGTGLDQEGVSEPLKPRWELPAGIPTASSVSTDFFYGFSPRVMAGEYPFGRGHLRERYREHVRRGTQFVEMEVAQFYAFCDRFGHAELRYLAIKGASNELGDDAQQIAESASVIARCMEVATRLLKIE